MLKLFDKYISHAMSNDYKRFLPLGDLILSQNTNWYLGKWEPGEKWVGDDTPLGVG